MNDDFSSHQRPSLQFMKSIAMNVDMKNALLCKTLGKTLKVLRAAFELFYVIRYCFRIFGLKVLFPVDS